MKTVYPGALPRAVTSWAFSPIFVICVYLRPSAVKSALVSGRNQSQLRGQAVNNGIFSSLCLL
jgi:hypothetical protein